MTKQDFFDYKEVKTFEITENARRVFFDFLRADEMIFSKINSKEAIEKYLRVRLGRQLKKEEAKGVACTRIYYDDNGEMAFMEIFNHRGYMVSMLNLRAFLDNPECNGTPACGDEYTQTEDESYSDSETIKIVETSIITRYNAQRVLDQLPTGTEDLTIKHYGYEVQFRKIKTGIYDLYILDSPTHFIDDIMPEHSFYQCGYKLINMKRVHRDGIVASGWLRSYGENGLLIKQEFYIGTPWGSVLINQVQEWQYDLAHNVVKTREIGLFHRHRTKVRVYELTDSGRIIQCTHYYKPRESDHLFLRDENAPPGMALKKKVDYAYDDAGWISEISWIFFGHDDYESNAGRATYEYDLNGNLLRQIIYDQDDQPRWIETYKYLSPNKIKITTIFNRSRY